MMQYVSIGSKVKDLRDKFQELCEKGLGGDTVEVFNADSNEWMPVTGFTYAGDDCLLKLYSDVIDDSCIATIEEAELMALEDRIHGD